MPLRLLQPISTKSKWWASGWKVTGSCWSPYFCEAGITKSCLSPLGTTTVYRSSSEDRRKMRCSSYFHGLDWTLFSRLMKTHAEDRQKNMLNFASILSPAGHQPSIPSYKGENIFPLCYCPSLDYTVVKVLRTFCSVPCLERFPRHTALSYLNPHAVIKQQWYGLLSIPWGIFACWRSPESKGTFVL